MKRKVAMITDGGKSLYRSPSTQTGMKLDHNWRARTRISSRSPRDLEDDALTYLSGTDAVRVDCLLASFEGKKTGFAGIDEALDEVARLLSKV